MNRTTESTSARLSKRLVKQEERTHKARCQRDAARAESDRLQANYDRLVAHNSDLCILLENERKGNALRAENARLREELGAAKRDIYELIGRNKDCPMCFNRRCKYRNGTEDCKPIWRGPHNYIGEEAVGAPFDEPIGGG